MKPKQSEMDAIVRQIYDAIQSKNHLSSTLLVLCGDHGMNDAGNHGGSAEGETSPALVFMSPKIKTISKKYECPSHPRVSSYDYYDTVEQSDIAPTLAALLGFPIPLNNLGVIIPQLLSFWPDGIVIAELSSFSSERLTVDRFKASAYAPKCSTNTSYSSRQLLKSYIRRANR